jgi:chromosome segregation ATPase
MEEHLKHAQIWLTSTMAAAFAVASPGCKNDAAPSEALQKLNGQLEAQIVEQDEQIGRVAAALKRCAADLAKTGREAVVVTAAEETVEIPALESEPSVASLEARKNELSDALETQKAMLTALESTTERCAKELEASRTGAKAATQAESSFRMAAAAKSPRSDLQRDP